LGWSSRLYYCTLWFLAPTHCPIPAWTVRSEHKWWEDLYVHGQWWSYLRIHCIFDQHSVWQDLITTCGSARSTMMRSIWLHDSVPCTISILRQ
jgi:hypothetical protein